MGIDAEVSKTLQKIMTKQGLNFRLNTKVMGAQKTGGMVKVQVEDAKDSNKKEEVIIDQILTKTFSKIVHFSLNVMYC